MSGEHPSPVCNCSPDQLGKQRQYGHHRGVLLGDLFTGRTVVLTCLVACHNHGTRTTSPSSNSFVDVGVSKRQTHSSLRQAKGSVHIHCPLIVSKRLTNVKSSRDCQQERGRGRKWTAPFRPFQRTRRGPRATVNTRSPLQTAAAYTRSQEMATV